MTGQARSRAALATMFLLIIGGLIAGPFLPHSSATWTGACFVVLVTGLMAAGALVRSAPADNADDAEASGDSADMDGAS